MRILTIINSLSIGGAERLVSELLPLFVERNVQIDLLILDGSKPSVLLDSANLTGSKVFVLSKHTSIYNPILIFRIIKYLRRYDLVHVHLFPALYWTAIAKMISFSKVKLIYTEHCTYNRRRNKSIYKLIDGLIYGIYNKIVCVSDLTYDKLEKHSTFKKGKVIIIDNGINLNNVDKAIAYNPKEIFREDPINTTYIIQVSGFRPQKDQGTLIKAMALLPVSFKLILIGDGDTIAVCKKLSSDLELDDRIYFLGIRTDIYQFLKMADVIVLSSYYEGLSMSSIEGMQSGNPFVASRVPGLEEIVEGAGVLFEVGDYKSLAGIIIRLTGEDAYRINVIKKCLERAKEYDIQKTVLRYIEVYNDVLQILDNNPDYLDGKLFIN